jgi:hypothetical protein
MRASGSGVGVKVGTGVDVLVGTGVGVTVTVEVAASVGVSAGLAGMILGMLHENAAITSMNMAGKDFFMRETIPGRESRVKAGMAVLTSLEMDFYRIITTKIKQLPS